LTIVNFVTTSFLRPNRSRNRHFPGAAIMSNPNNATALPPTFRPDLVPSVKRYVSREDGEPVVTLTHGLSFGARASSGDVGRQLAGLMEQGKLVVTRAEGQGAVFLNLLTRSKEAYRLVFDGEADRLISIVHLTGEAAEGEEILTS